MERTQENPLLALGAVPTGFAYVSPCCTAAVDEFVLPDGTKWCIGSVAGHGFGKPWEGTVLEINETGTLVHPDKRETRIYWDPKKDKEIK